MKINLEYFLHLFTVFTKIIKQKLHAKNHSKLLRLTDYLIYVVNTIAIKWLSYNIKSLIAFSQNKANLIICQNHRLIIFEPYCDWTWTRSPLKTMNLSQGHNHQKSSLFFPSGTLFEKCITSCHFKSLKLII